MDGLFCIEIQRADGRAISSSEWDAFIESDPELERVHETKGVNPMTGEEVIIPYREPTAVWIAHPQGITDSRLVFRYDDGGIYSYNVDQHFVSKGKKIAERLGAEIIETID